MNNFEIGNEVHSMYGNHKAIIKNVRHGKDGSTEYLIDCKCGIKNEWNTLYYWIKETKRIEMNEFNVGDEVNDEIKIGDMVYYKDNNDVKIYGIVRHIGRLLSLDRTCLAGELGCVWSEWNGKWKGLINPRDLGFMLKEEVYKVPKEEKMPKFKVGDRVKQIRDLAPYENPYATITGIDGKHIKHKHDNSNHEFETEEENLILVQISKYEELKEKIKNLQNGWDKEADDILKEIYDSSKNRGSYRRWIMIDIANDGHIIIRDYDGDNAILWDETFENQCEKLKLFKEALLWLLDDSDIKKNEKEEKIKEIEKQRDELAMQIRSLNLKIEELRS